MNECMPEIALVSRVTERELASLRELCGQAYDVVDFTRDREGLAERGGDVEIVYGMVRPFEFERLGRLKWIQATWTGIENLLYPAMVESDVVITCSKGHCSEPLAESVVGAIYYFARDIPGFLQPGWKKDWDAVSRQRVVNGSRALILGLGTIGTVVAEKLEAIGVRCRGVTSSGNPTAHCREVYTLDSVRDHLDDIDHCIDCLPATPHTYRYVDNDFLGRLARGAFFANIGRGSTVDEAALLRHLDSGHLIGAMLDVTDPEPPEPDSALLTHPRILCTGHQAAFPLATTNLAFATFLANLTHWLAGNPERMQHRVNKRLGY